MRVSLVSYGPKVHSQLFPFPVCASVFSERSYNIGFQISLSIQEHNADFAHY